ncbi:hypothetical protein SAMD00019534_055280 [Acytostelium subglobosum LB1]|uniref:hypothetical protein n=1 Tax=Acytostelium subglobosum LB1 TaxID=1410327 RepID=UPI000644AFB2|nr:hypothetical protein SAMD00019534_055280 [Acytostelium subglobosum LB1]GAM22353.1 hypothetical protein SAMD00019534_055280 [Acytostelium subglobosum LB1]|eukprot:XP_012754473.1 hypothetical protein SAMD00019534_055280 [Acytostelium subglobosum LB1]
MNIEQAESNKQLQQNEVEALSSIYPHLNISTTSRSTELYSLWITPDNDTDTNYNDTTTESENEDSMLLFSFTYTSEYPSNQPPSDITVKSGWLLPEHGEHLVKQMLPLFIPGELVIFQMIVWLQENAVKCIEQYINHQSSIKHVNSSRRQRQQQRQVNTNTATVLKDESIIPSMPTQPTPTIYTGQPITDKKSKFQAHLAIVHSEEEVNLVLDKLLLNKKIADATHNMYAFRIKMPNGQINEYCDDDGEAGAGDKMLFTLIRNQCEEVLVVVTRWFGGVLLGGARYHHIINVTKEMIQLYQTKQLTSSNITVTL